MHSSPLPPLRNDLQLFEGPPDYDGSRTWRVYDPVRHRYFHLGRTAFEILSRWSTGSAQELVTRLRDETTCELRMADIEEMIAFLRDNNLLRGDAPGMRETYLHQAKANRLVWWRALLRNYLFFRLPVVRPERFLAATQTWTAPFFRNGFWLMIALAGLVGLLLVMRQWDLFLNTFLHFFSWEGAALYGVTLALVKIAHELGHAYAATRYGCKVPSMGIAFLVLWPVLYTDTTDAWRLQHRKPRLVIGAAGVLVELGIAAIATLAWSFLPDGLARSAAFFLATTSWVMTLSVNLSPLMRFDGYYLLSDLWGIHNLQERAFALGRWHLRERLFGLGAPAPEPFPPRVHRSLLLFAWAAWLYRLVLFIGIALLVYHFFFKLLGIVLFAVEMAWFVGRPLWNELRAWWKMRDKIGFNQRFRWSLGMLFILSGLAVIPWNSRVELPALYESARHVMIYAPAPAQLVRIAVKNNQEVHAGELLFVLDSPELRHDLAQTQRRIHLLEQRIDRESTTADRLEHLSVLQQELATERSTHAGLLQQIEQLTLRANFDGKIVDLADALQPGRWIDERLALGRLVTPSAFRVQGYADAEDAARLHAGAGGHFHPDDPALPKIPVSVARIDTVNIRLLDLPHLASTRGGPIPVRENGLGALVPDHAIYRVVLHTDAQDLGSGRTVRGTAQVQGDRRSLLGRMWRTVGATLVRESGF